MIPFLRTVIIFSVIVVGAGLGAQMHTQAQRHATPIRTPGQMADNYIRCKLESCSKTSNPDHCALVNNITI